MSMQPKNRTQEEQEAALFMVGLSSGLSNTDESSEGETLSQTTNNMSLKKRRTSPPAEYSSVLHVAPYPFFDYIDHSRDCNVDRLAILDTVGRIPSFPIKLHAILSDPDLKSIVSWDDHGRSFRVIKSSEFESDVLPRFFDHKSMASFQRQLNGWNFCRVRTGEYRNSYYEEHFLRSMPWLCKKMCRLGAGEKMSQKSEFQPDLAAISSMYPLPNSVCYEIQVILETIKKDGPKAKTSSSLIAQAVHDNDHSSHVSSSQMTSREVTEPDGQLATINGTNAGPPSLLPNTVSNMNALLACLQQPCMPMLSVENQLLAGILTELQNQNMSMLTTIASSIASSNNTQNNSLENILMTSLLQALQNQVQSVGVGQVTNNARSTLHDNAINLAANTLTGAVNQGQATANVDTTIAAPSFSNQLRMALQQQDMPNQVGNSAGPSQVSIDSSDTRSGRNSISNVRTLDQILELLKNGSANDSNLSLEQINNLFQQY